jgi:hypothetical protein
VVSDAGESLGGAVGYPSKKAGVYGFREKDVPNKLDIVNINN